MSMPCLTIAGTGIKSIAHLTVEVKAHIEKSPKLLYLVNEPALEEWIKKINPRCESLAELYFKYESREACYQAISHYILSVLKEGEDVCVVLYGHPTVFAQPALAAVYQARRLNYETIILPGISAEDCLFADLAIDPGTHGCQSFEATDFLLRQHSIMPYSHLILWQVGVIGALGHPHNHDNRPNAEVLCHYLMTVYPKDHRITLYEATQYPGFHSTIEHLALFNLPDIKISSISTLYVPPIKKAKYNKAMIKKLGMDESVFDTE